MAIRLAPALVLLLAGPALAVDCTVTTTADNTTAPAGSLRACLELAEATAGHDRVFFGPAFDPPGTIVLVANLPSLADPAGVTVDGATSGRVTVRGGGTADAFFSLLGGNNELLHLTLQNLVGSGWGAGSAISVANTSGGNRIAFNTILQVADALYVQQGGQNTVEYNVVTGTTVNAIHFNGALPGGCLRSRVAHNVVSQVGSAFSGILTVDANCLDIVDNTVVDAPNVGIRLGGPQTSGVLVQGNTLVRARIAVVSGAHGNRVAFNTVLQPPGAGIMVGDANTQLNVIVGNLVHGAQLPGGRGIHVWAGADGVELLHNSVVEGAGHGIAVEATVTGYVLENNLVLNCGGGGIAIDAPEPSGLVTHNLTYGNQLLGCDAGQCALGDGGFEEDPWVDTSDGGARITDCRSAAVDRAQDLGGRQPDLNGDGGGLWNGQGPDIGAVESSCLERLVPVVLAAQANAAAQCDTPFRYQPLVLQAGRPVAVWAASAPPAGLAVDPATGEVSWVPAASQAGQHQVALHAVNVAGDALQTLTIDVTCADGGPADAGAEGGPSAPPFRLQLRCGCDGASAAGPLALLLLAVGLRCRGRSRRPGR